MFSNLWYKIREVIERMVGPKTIESTLHITPIISNKMTDAMELWGLMYKDEAPWLHEATFENPVAIHSLGLPSLIASEKARMATIELKSTITVPTVTKTEVNPNYKPPSLTPNGLPTLGTEKPIMTVDEPLTDDARAKFLNDAYQREVIDKIRTQLEYGIAKGGLVIKPYIVFAPKTDENGDVIKGEKTPQLQVEYIQADCFYPIAFNSSGRITEAVFVQTKQDKNTVYRRLEYHKLVGTTVTVKNKAYKSRVANEQDMTDINAIDLGVEIPLSEVPEWADLKESTKINNVDRLLFGYFKMPEANNIDQYSPLGISGFARAVHLIKQADIQYSRLLWEFEATETAIDIDRDALTDVKDRSGNHHNARPIMQQRLYRPIDLGESDTYKVYNPQIRDVNLVNGLNQILMRIEDVCALSRGTLSEVTSEARTATELKILKQRSYSANVDIQHALEMTLKDVVYIMNVYCELYEVTEAGDYSVSFEWDDSILVDIETELTKRLTLMQNGLTSKLETRMWYFGESEAQAQEALDMVSKEAQEISEQNMIMQSMMGEAVANGKEKEEDDSNNSSSRTAKQMVTDSNGKALGGASNKAKDSGE